MTFSKKIIALFLTVLMVFALCSCNNTGVTSSDASNLLSGGSSVISTTTSENSGSTTSTAKKPCSVHSFDAATCTKAEKCWLCGATGKAALGHDYEGKKTCSRCKAENPDWIEWFTTGKISITKAEVNQIVSMQYKKPKNVIVMIGDGMGANDIILTEKHNKEECFDFGLVLNQIKNTGFATTYSASSSVTDSAASGTALATGVKTNNGYIGKDPNGNNLTNASELARKLGKKVGIVTNDDITGATPSAFAVHNISRTNYSELAKSFVEFMPDVLIGQGFSYFSSLNLSSALYSKDILKYNSVLNQDPKCKKPFIGFFSEDILADSSNTLAYVTEVALNRLKNNDKGFFLMVENAATDKAGHNNKINGKVDGVVTFDRAVAVVLKFMKENPDTLLIITSDHETGGVQLSKNDKLTNDLFTTTNHTGTDVRTFALGYGSEYFSGKTVDNTDIAKFVHDVLKK